MKIMVPVKRVVDYNVNVRVKSDETGVELANVKMSMNLSWKCEIAHCHTALTRANIPPAVSIRKDGVICMSNVCVFQNP